VEDDAIDVRPEFLEHVEEAVEGDLRFPARVGFHLGIGLARVIQIANAGGRVGSDDLGKVERAVAGVGTGDDEAAIA